MYIIKFEKFGSKEFKIKKLEIKLFAFEKI